MPTAARKPVGVFFIIQVVLKKNTQTPVGAAEGCDLLTLIFSESLKIKIKRSQPSAAPTGAKRLRQAF
jgi:hypothetical protein